MPHPAGESRPPLITTQRLALAGGLALIVVLGVFLADAHHRQQATRTVAELRAVIQAIDMHWASIDDYDGLTTRTAGDALRKYNLDHLTVHRGAIILPSEQIAVHAAVASDPTLYRLVIGTVSAPISTAHTCRAIVDHLRNSAFQANHIQVHNLGEPAGTDAAPELCNRAGAPRTVSIVAIGS